MLLKCTPDGKRIKVNGVPGQGNVARGTGMRMTMSTTPTMSPRVHRKVIRAPHKRSHSGKMSQFGGKLSHYGGKAYALTKYGSKLTHFARLHAGKPHASRGKIQQQSAQRSVPDPCDNSNDSGLGPDHHLDNTRINTLRFSDQNEMQWAEESEENRQRRMEIKLESDDANDNFTFPEPHCSNLTTFEPSTSSMALHLSSEQASSSSNDRVLHSSGKIYAGYRSNGKILSSNMLGSKLKSSGKFASGKIASSGKLASALTRKRFISSGPPTLSSQLSNVSRDGRVQLVILCQPEQQHRARYQTEGSRGAVKDNSGNGFPVVKLIGYSQPAVLQVFIGTDTGRVAPHMFYQACRVSGKNSTPCTEKKEDGTVLIEVDLEPSKDWQVTCDCVGILKERNVDVEHRFGDQLSTPTSTATTTRGKKKSTRCRMVFRTRIAHEDGSQETLQVCSDQIICTQPPGVPEICRKSLVSCSAAGGLELFLLGKNFLKDSRVVFSHRCDTQVVWEEQVIPDKDFLHQSHLVCRVPAYGNVDITESVRVWLSVTAAGRASDPVAFTYTPPALEHGPQHASRHQSAPQYNGDEAQPVLLWGAGAGELMPPPALPGRRPSVILPDALKSDPDDSSCSPPPAIETKLEPDPEPREPLASFAHQLRAMHTQVHTDKMMESVAAAIFNSHDAEHPIYPEPIRPPQLATELMLPTPELGPVVSMAEVMGETSLHAADKLEELVTSSVEALAEPAPAALLDTSPPLLCEPNGLLCSNEGSAAVKTPPAAVKSMILNAAAEILTSDSAMNALVTSAINTANILTTTEQAPTPAAPDTEGCAAMNQAVSQAVTQAVSQAVSHAVSQAVSQTPPAAPMQDLTNMSDSDLLSYINPSCFDQV